MHRSVDMDMDQLSNAGSFRCHHLLSSHFFSLLLFSSRSLSFVCTFTAGFSAIHLLLRSGQLQVVYIPPPKLDCLWIGIVFIKVILFLYFLKTYVVLHNGKRNGVTGCCPLQLLTPGIFWIGPTARWTYCSKRLSRMETHRCLYLISALIFGEDSII